MNIDGVRWMVSFWHADGSWKNEPDFPRVDFWHPDRETSRAEAAPGPDRTGVRSTRTNVTGWQPVTPTRAKSALAGIPAVSGSSDTAT